MERFKKLYGLLQTKAKDRQSFELDVIRHVVTCSYNIWCKCNWYQCLFVGFFLTVDLFVSFCLLFIFTSVSFVLFN